MTKGRLEAFSDGVIAIIITIMVLELHPPEGFALHDLAPVLPKFLGYVLSFVYVGIYWNNHHHLLHAVRNISGRVMWANLLLLFWLSMIPFTTAWMSEHHTQSVPVALYGVNLFMCGMAYTLLVFALLAVNGPETGLADAIGKDWKGKVSMAFYVAAIPLAFVDRRISLWCYIAVALFWVVPDKRMERVIEQRPE